VSAVQDLTTEFERSDDGVPVYLSALLLSAEASPIGERGRQLVSNLVDRLSTVIEALVTEGTISAWVAPREMASLLVSCANGMALQTRLDPAGPGVGAMASQLAGLMLAASTGPAVATSRE